MGRVVLTICRSCRPPKKREVFDPASFTGDVLYRAVKALRRERELKEVFAVEETKCLKQCKHPCAIELTGKKRPTYLRRQVHASADVGWVVDTAVAYAALPPDGELPEEKLPGEAGD